MPPPPGGLSFALQQLLRRQQQVAQAPPTQRTSNQLPFAGIGLPPQFGFGQQRATGIGSRTIGDVNLGAISAFQQLPPDQQQALARQGISPQFGQAFINGRGSPADLFGPGSSIVRGPTRTRAQRGLGGNVPGGAADPLRQISAFTGVPLRGTVGEDPSITAARRRQFGTSGVPLPAGTNVSGVNNTNNIGQPGSLSTLAQLISGLSGGGISRQQRNVLGQQTQQTQAGLDQLRQRAAASGNLDRFGQQAASFLGASEQGRENALNAQRNIEIQQLLQALGLEVDLAARLAQAAAIGGFGAGAQSFLGAL